MRRYQVFTNTPGGGASSSSGHGDSVIIDPSLPGGSMPHTSGGTQSSSPPQSSTPPASSSSPPQSSSPPASSSTPSDPCDNCTWETVEFGESCASVNAGHGGDPLPDWELSNGKIVCSTRNAEPLPNGGCRVDLCTIPAGML